MSSFDRFVLRRIRNCIVWVASSTVGALGLTAVADPAPVVLAALATLLALYFAFLVSAV